MNEIQKIMFGELRPWLDTNAQADGFYKPMTRQLKNIQTAFNTRYELNFIRPFSDRTQYYKKIIDNNITGFCNAFVAEVANATANRLAYKLNKFRNLLYSKIKEVGNIITTQQLELSHISSQHADFAIDKPYKESTYIIFYLLSALIKCCMEIQYYFRDAIHEDNLMEIPDFYTRLLQRQVPTNTFISEIKMYVMDTQQDIVEESPIKYGVSTKIAQDNYTRFMEEVEAFQFTELPKYKCLSSENQIRLIRNIVGKGTPYAVAMLHFLEYPEHLKTVYSMNKEKQYKHIAKCLNAVERSVKGNFLVLKPTTNEDRSKYTAAEHEETVKNDYFSLTDKTL